MKIEKRRAAFFSVFSNRKERNLLGNASVFSKMIFLSGKEEKVRRECG